MIVVRDETVATMNARHERIFSLLAASEALSTNRLCDVCIEVTSMSGAGIMLMSDDDTSFGSVGTTDAVSALIEELQFMLGEGPCIDAYELEVPIAEPNLGAPSGRWPGFTPPALEAGVRAIFSFPLRVGAVCIGSLDLYRDRSGELSYDEHADALIMAEVVAQSVVTMQAGGTSGPLHAELTSGYGQSFVYQAAGMVSAQLGVSVDEALVRLRAHAFANSLRVAELARDVVERRVRFDPTAT